MGLLDYLSRRRRRGVSAHGHRALCLKTVSIMEQCGQENYAYFVGSEGEGGGQGAQLMRLAVSVATVRVCSCLVGGVS